MNSTEKPKNKVIIPIICAIVCVVIIAVTVGFALSGKEKADNNTTEAPSQPVTEGSAAPDTVPSTGPLADESSERDNIGYDIFY